jgi:sec-independent protein translocase protein TatA
MFGLGPMEMVIVLVIAVLLFGKRLPEVARGLGKGVVEFKKGIRGIEDEVDRSQYSSGRGRVGYEEDRDAVSAPRFEPPNGEGSMGQPEASESKPADSPSDRTQA